MKLDPHEEGMRWLLQARQDLDKYYIPTRYPNGLPGGVPYEAFDEGDALKAIGLASQVIEYVRQIMETTES